MSKFKEVPRCPYCGGEMRIEKPIFADNQKIFSEIQPIFHSISYCIGAILQVDIYSLTGYLVGHFLCNK